MFTVRFLLFKSSVNFIRFAILIFLKPIFHQNAKYLAWGTFASPNAKDRTFALPNARIPTCWYLLR